MNEVSEAELTARMVAIGMVFVAKPTEHSVIERTLELASVKASAVFKVNAACSESVVRCPLCEYCARAPAPVLRGGAATCHAHH